jgi:hypothetical protein
MRRLRRWAMPIFFSTLATGCFNLHARTGRVSDTQVREHVEESGKAVFLFWGLYRTSDPGGTIWGRETPAVSSLHVHTYLSFTDAVVSAVTLGMIIPWTVETEAEILE